MGNTLSHKSDTSLNLLSSAITAVDLEERARLNMINTYGADSEKKLIQDAVQNVLNEIHGLIEQKDEQSLLKLIAEHSGPGKHYELKNSQGKITSGVNIDVSQLCSSMSTSRNARQLYQELLGARMFTVLRAVVETEPFKHELMHWNRTRYYDLCMMNIAVEMKDEDYALSFLQDDVLIMQEMKETELNSEITLLDCILTSFGMALSNEAQRVASRLYELICAHLREQQRQLSSPASVLDIMMDTGDTVKKDKMEERLQVVYNMLLTMIIPSRSVNLTLSLIEQLIFLCSSNAKIVQAIFIEYQEADEILRQLLNHHHVSLVKRFIDLIQILQQQSSSCSKSETFRIMLRELLQCAATGKDTSVLQYMIEHVSGFQTQDVLEIYHTSTPQTKTIFHKYFNFMDPTFLLDKFGNDTVEILKQLNHLTQSKQQQ